METSYSRGYINNLKKQVVAQDMTSWNIREKYQLQLSRLIDIADIARIENDLMIVINCYKQILRKLIGQIDETMRSKALKNLNECLRISSQQNTSEYTDIDKEYIMSSYMMDVNELLNEAEEIIYYSLAQSKITTGNPIGRK